jgi:Armadillo/beta-catenin-like repeat
MLASRAASAEARVRALAAPSGNVTQASAARAVLNAVVGNRDEKAAHLAASAPSALVAVLASASPSAAAAAAAALGSLVCGFDDGAHAVAAAGAAPHLVAALFSPDLRVVQAAARALKVLSANPVSSASTVDALFQAPAPGPAPAPARIVALVADRQSGLSETGSSILAHVAASARADTRSVLTRAGAVPCLVAVLADPPATRHHPSIEAALTALSSLAAGNAPLSRALIARHGIISCVLPLVRARQPAIRLGAARLLSSLHRAASISHHALAIVIAELVGLLHPESPHSIRIDAAHVLSQLVVDAEQLQRLTCDAGVIHQLVLFLDVAAAAMPVAAGTPGPSLRPESSVPGRPERLTSLSLADRLLYTSSQLSPPLALLPQHSLSAPPMPSYSNQLESHEEDQKQLLLLQKHVEQKNRICPDDGPMCELVESALSCFAAVCSLWDAGREACIRARVLPSIVLALDHPHCAIVTAAVKCIRSLSRSVKIVRRELVFVNIAVPLLRLLRDTTSSVEIMRQASACICNVVVEFSPLKQTVLQDGGVSTLVGLLHSSDRTLCVNALWGLQNLLLKASVQVKRAVMAELTYDELFSLCMDNNVRERALTLMRNLVCPSSGQPSTTSAGVDSIVEGMGGKLMTVLASALRQGTPASTAEQALYVISNVAAGAEEHKVLLFNSELPKLVLEWTEHNEERVRIAAVWCAINLGWRGKSSNSNLHANHNGHYMMASSDSDGEAGPLGARTIELDDDSDDDDDGDDEEGEADADDDVDDDIGVDEMIDRHENDSFEERQEVAMLDHSGTHAGNVMLTNDDNNQEGDLEGGRHVSPRVRRWRLSRVERTERAGTYRESAADAPIAEAPTPNDTRAARAVNDDNDDDDIVARAEPMAMDTVQPDEAIVVGRAPIASMRKDGKESSPDSAPVASDMNGAPSSAAGSGYSWRIRRLRELGYERRLRRMVDGETHEVVGRVRAALEMFEPPEHITDDPPLLTTSASEQEGLQPPPPPI